MRFSLWHPPSNTRTEPLVWVMALALAISIGHTLDGGRGVAIAAALTVVLAAIGLWRRRRPRARGALVLHDGTLRRHDDTAAGDLLVSRGELLGLSLLVAPDHRGAMLALTTPSRVRVLPIDVRNEADLEPLARLLSPVRSEGLRVSKGALRNKDAATLIGELIAQFPHAAERLYLRGARGESIALDRSELAVDTDRIVLDRPYETRAFAFFERAGLVVSAYQATWVRQRHNDAAHELVFVAALPGEVERGWPVLDTAEAAVLLRAPRHSIDALLFTSLHRRIDAAQPQRTPERRRSSATLDPPQRN